MLKIIKPFLISLVIITGLFVAFNKANAQIQFNIFRSIVPETDSKYFLGTTTPSTRAWLGVITDEVCLAGDCRTTWPSGGGGAFAWTVQSWGVSTSTRLGFLNGFLSTASSTINASTTVTGALTSTGGFYAQGLGTCQTNNFLTWSAGSFGCEAGGSGAGGFDFPNVQSWGNATSTTLGFLQGFLSTASSTLASTTVQNNLTVGGTIYGNLTGLASLATALNANGANCSSGNSPLGVNASGAAEDCFDVWTEAENTSAAYTPQSRTITVAGTSDQITSSAGAQDLTANRTWTLSLPNRVIFPVAFNSTYGTTTYASSTALTSTDLFATNFLATGSSTLQNFTGVNATTSSATTSNLHISNNLFFNGVSGSTWATFCTAITGGSGLCDGSDDGGGGGGFDFSYSQDLGFGLTGSATSTKIKFSAGLIASTTSFFDYATATVLTVTGNTYLPTLTSALVQAGSDGLLAEYAGTSCTNQFVRSLSALGAATCATVGTADVAGLDISDDTNLGATWPIVLSGDTVTWDGLATTSSPTAGNLFYSNGVRGLVPVATSSVTFNSPITTSGTAGYIVGGSGFTLDVDDIQPTDLASADFGEFTCNGTTCSLDDNTTVTGWVLGNFTGTNATFTNATTTGGFFSNLLHGLSLRVGGTATTTIDTAGNVTIPSGSELTITGKSDGCATFASGVLNSTGSACGSGGGGSAYEIATTSSIAVPQVAYFTQTAGRTTLGGVATGTISVPTGLTVTANRYALGGSTAIGLDTGYVIPLQSTLDAKALGATTITIAGTSNQITSSAGAQDLSANRTWTLSIPTQFNIQQASTTQLSAFWLKVGATASTTIDNEGDVLLPAAGTLTVPALTSALVQTDGAGLFAEYAGTSCTNQFVRSLSALGAATCNSISNSDWSGTDLSVANGGTGLSTFGGTDTILFTTTADNLSSDSPFVYVSGRDNMGIGTSTPRWALQVASSTGPQLTLSDGTLTSNHWSFRNAGGLFYLATSSPSTFATSTSDVLSFTANGVMQVRNGLLSFASSTFIGNVTGLGVWDLGGASSFEIPNNGAPTVDATGEIAIDTTTDLFEYYGASNKRLIPPFQRLGFTYATTSWNATTTILLGPAYIASTVDFAYCETNAGTVGVSLYDGTNRANYIPTASTTINKNGYSTNNTFTAGESMRVDLGTPASSPTRIACSFGWYPTDD